MLDKKLIGKRLKAYREKLNQSQQRVSDGSGLTQTQITNFENGNFSNIDVFFQLLDYYRPYFDFVNLLDKKDFKPIQKLEGPEVRAVRKSIVTAKIQDIKKNVAENFKDLEGLIDELYQ